LLLAELYLGGNYKIQHIINKKTSCIWIPIKRIKWKNESAKMANSL